MDEQQDHTSEGGGERLDEIQEELRIK